MEVVCQNILEGTVGKSQSFVPIFQGLLYRIHVVVSLDIVLMLLKFDLLSHILAYLLTLSITILCLLDCRIRLFSSNDLAF